MGRRSYDNVLDECGQSLSKTFSSYIVNKRFEELQFDFTPDTVAERTKFYDQLLEHVFTPATVAKSYIAGGDLLLKYKTNAEASVADPDEFKRLESSSSVQVWLKCKHLSNRALRLFLNLNWRECKFDSTTVLPNGAFARLATQTIPANTLGGEQHPPINFDCIFTTYGINSTLKFEPFEPCRIGYNYQGRIHLSRWFLTGG